MDATGWEPSETEVRDLLNGAIADAYYDDCRGWALTEVDDCAEEVCKTAAYPEPYPSYIVLRCCLCCLEASSRFTSYDTATDLFIGLICYLNVPEYWPPRKLDAFTREHGKRVADRWRRNREGAAERRREEVRQWPRRSRQAAYAWLLLARTWPETHEYYHDELPEIIRFWAEAAS